MQTSTVRSLDSAACAATLPAHAFPAAVTFSRLLRFDSVTVITHKTNSSLAENATDKVS